MTIETTEVSLHTIKEALARITPYVHKTPLQCCRTLSKITDNQVYFKLENMQKTGAFKLRGAANKILNLSPEQAARGVVSASAGNHAQGVAWAAGTRSIPAVIVMPEQAPLAKIRATEDYGAQVVLHGTNYDEAYQFACHMQHQQGMTFIHAFDDDDVIAGQGTIALEILSKLYDVDAIIAPVGGGGLLSGLAIAMKQYNPRIRVIGVQAAGAPSMARSLAAAMPLCLESVQTIADGIAVKQPGDKTFHYIQHYVDEMLLVNDEEIADAILFMLERGKLTTEGAGVVGVAALLAGKVQLSGQKIAVVVSGGNIDPHFLSQLIARKHDMNEHSYGSS